MRQYQDALGPCGFPLFQLKPHIDRLAVFVVSDLLRPPGSNQVLPERFIPSDVFLKGHGLGRQVGYVEFGQIQVCR